ncbi:uracil-DNA glycosylase [uncultured Oxalicibacterium sp.]|uniref:uracil-DNA glycosylase n=1 Tax=uncultured Oxalicibacterium sp. TaxID=1168540 RepID=UPI0025D00501|nr:uracil-DNA glycosylase [uncultured Oxalicibacterium sp.]
MSTTERRHAFLQEMGLAPLWVRRDHHATEMPQDNENPLPEMAEELAWRAAPEQPVEVVPIVDISPASSEPAIAHASENAIAPLDWIPLQEMVSGCKTCGLCHGRTRTVFGTGDQKARWLFVGEGPGRNEDMQGLPFVGPAGKLLDNMMAAMGLRRGDNTYIANIVKCRPTDGNKRDRPPTQEEAAACMPYLERQIALINPTVIIALGKTAALSLLALDPATPVSRLRGSVHRYAGKPLIVTYHPAYLLRNMRDKGKTWADLCLAMETFRQTA